jgi:hypothetical protein
MTLSRDLIPSSLAREPWRPPAAIAEPFESMFVRQMT